MGESDGRRSMKLRNKKTNEIWDIPKRRYPTVQEDDISFFAMLGTNGELFSYRSLAELNEEWEDTKPTEPLIKDEKIRKAVRAWADKAKIKEVRVDRSGSCLLNYPALIQFHGTPFSELKNREYTIAELCGEEEE